MAMPKGPTPTCIAAAAEPKKNTLRVPRCRPRRRSVVVVARRSSLVVVVFGPKATIWLPKIVFYVCF